jgi:small subunit ribosomal protein S23
MRKIPTQVPAAVSRLLQSTALPTPPVWFAPVLSHPPPTVPARQTPSRSPGANDLPVSLTRHKESRSHKMSHLKEPKPRPKEIVYQEDRIRRQFFKDFPFEALRPVSLVEGTHVGEGSGVTGSEWTSLEQRGAYPTVEE